MSKETDLLIRKIEREKQARKQAEKLLEEKSLELYESNQKLKKLNNNLEYLVEERTRKLRETEQEYFTLVESITDIICKVNLRGEVVFVNQIASTIMGQSKEELIGQNVLSFIPSEYRSKVFKYFARQFFQNKCISYYDLPIKTNQNNVLWVRVNVQFTEDKCQECDLKRCFLAGLTEEVVSSNNCHFNEIIVVAHNITERRNNELEIARNLRQQEILTEISVNYNSIADFESNTKEAVRIIGQHTGVSRVYVFEDSTDGLLTSNTYEWCNDGIAPQIKDLQNIPYEMIPSWKRLLNEEGIVYSEKIEELPEDIRAILEPQAIKSIIVLPLIESGNIFGFIGFDECDSNHKWSKSELELLRTVSSTISTAFLRNRIQTDLVLSEKENRGIIDSIPDEILRLNREGQVISFKSRCEDSIFAKLNRPDVNSIVDVLSEDLSNSFISSIEECIVKGDFEFNFSSFHHHEMQYFEARFAKLKSSEVLVIVRNVTELKAKEKQLNIAKNKAEQASKAKSEFLANVSHEIRTPMNAILGFSEWLHTNVENQQHKNYLHTIMTSGRNLLALINDILDLSKIESGKMNIELEPMQCKIVINQIKQVFKQKLEANNLAFNISVDHSVPHYIYMDEVRFYQILFNLVGNAIKFTSKGYIHVSASAVKTSDPNSINLILNVEDTGIGIKEDQQENVFKAFTQQSGQSNRYYEGTGLGLTIVGGLLKKLNGEISLKSEVGRGSKFTIKFKDVKIAEVSAEEDQKAKELNDFVLEPCKILIVDDLKFNILVLKRIIEFDNVTFLEAESGEKAIEIMEMEPPDIVFMDIRMPGMNGYDATEVIRNNPDWNHIPVVAFTASIMNDELERIYKLFDEYLQKPVFRKDVFAVLKKFLKIKYLNAENAQVIENEVKLSGDCIANLPEIIDGLENGFLDDWKKIKNDLIIYEIEDFSKKLSDFAFKKSCVILDNYCKELDLAIQSFDIELIEKHIGEFETVIAKLKVYLE
ncbi:ATP-binding protein [Marinifilum flexuosum]|uniref:histidine kinase n=1 Tax=Marinifilum flexuosum TaxID=1117708 RepID=A0A419X312_9BACT|nr:ATP-binding protein [Marinifilum flexuosum]RKE02134.1 PAS domain S-box-containing protein [Marinifilum flexuosum]